MLKAFTKNYNDKSTEAGFEFVFFCDLCGDGYKSSFIASETFKKKKGTKLLGQGASIVGSLAGGKGSKFGSAGSQAGNAMSSQFEGMTPEWHKEHEKAFDKAQNESKVHFHRCPACNKYTCDQCWNEDATLCTVCAPRTEVLVAKAHGQAAKRNIEEAGSKATVWQGTIESKTTICPACGKPAGAGKFCNNCGQSMEMRECTKCGAKNAVTVRFCNNCGDNMQQQQQAAAAPPPSGKCPGCGKDNPPGTKFCGECGFKYT